MNIILHHLDELLDFHRKYDKDYLPRIDNDEIFLDEQKDKIKKYENERNKIFSKITSEEEGNKGNYILQLYRYLIKDGYIEYENKHHYITLSGKIFEGYVYRENTKMKEEKKEEQLKLEVRFVQVILAFGSVGFLVLEILKWYLEKHTPCHCHDIFYLLY